MGRNTLLPRTTKRRITTNLKTIYNQNCQKIKLHGTLRTKELKKHSPRPIGGLETGKSGSLVERTHSKVVDLAGEAGLTEWETEGSKLAVKYCRRL